MSSTLAEPTIRFWWEGVEYTASMRWYADGALIRLPSGELIRANRWLESRPPYPAELEVVQAGLSDNILHAQKVKLS